MPLRSLITFLLNSFPTHHAFPIYLAFRTTVFSLELPGKVTCFPFQAIWENQFYYLFGFLFIVLGILFISCSQIAIVVTYFLLCAEVGPFP